MNDGRQEGSGQSSDTNIAASIVSATRSCLAWVSPRRKWTVPLSKIKGLEDVESELGSLSRYGPSCPRGEESAKRQRDGVGPKAQSDGRARRCRGPAAWCLVLDARLGPPCSLAMGRQRSGASTGAYCEESAMQYFFARLEAVGAVSMAVVKAAGVEKFGR